MSRRDSARAILVVVLAAATSGTVVAQSGTFLDEREARVDELHVSRWNGAFEENTLGQEDPVLKPGFPAHQDQRFSFEITDRAANRDRDQVEILFEAADLVVVPRNVGQALRRRPLGVIVDSINGITLLETGPDTGVFRPAGASARVIGAASVSNYVLVSNEVDDEQVPNMDDGSGVTDVTIRAMPEDTVLLLYKKRPAARARVCAARGADAVVFVRTRVTILIHTEPYHDAGYGPDHTGRCDGAFSFADLDGDGSHDSGEPSEPWTDHTMEGSRTVFAPTTTIAAALGDLDLLNIAFAQACIEFRSDGLRSFDDAAASADPEAFSVFVKESPGGEPFEDEGHERIPGSQGDATFNFLDDNGNGLHDLGEDAREPFTDCNATGSYDAPVDLLDGMDGSPPEGAFQSPEQRTTALALGDRDESTLEIFIVNRIRSLEKRAEQEGEKDEFVNLRGQAFIEKVALEEVRNVIFVRAASVGRFPQGPARDFVNTAHEALHVLMNATDAEHVEDHTNIFVSAGTDDEDAPQASKRMSQEQVDRARTEPKTARLRTAG